MNAIMNTPKTMNCKDCGVKPKQQLIHWSYGDSDDELFLVHWCNGTHKQFPKRGTFTHLYPNGQRPLLINAWNEAQNG